MNQEWQPIETAPKDGTPIIVGRWLNGYQLIRPIFYRETFNYKMTKQQEIDQLRALAANCERDMQLAIRERDAAEKLLNDIRLLLDDAGFVKKFVKIPLVPAPPKEPTECL